jgi:hypothetical protein
MMTSLIAFGKIPQGCNILLPVPVMCAPPRSLSSPIGSPASRQQHVKVFMMKDDRRAAIMTMMMMMMATERKLRNPSPMPPPSVLHNPEKSFSPRAWRGISPKNWTNATCCVHCRREGPPVSRGIAFLQPAGGSTSMMAGKYVLITLQLSERKRSRRRLRQSDQRGAICQPPPQPPRGKP